MNGLPDRPLTKAEFEEAQERAELFSIGADIEEFDTVEEFNSYLAAREASEASSFAGEERNLRNLALAALFIVALLKFGDLPRVRGWA